MLVEDMASYGKYPVDWSKEATLRAAVPTYDMGMYEQNVLIYRITNDPSMLDKVRQLLCISHCLLFLGGRVTGEQCPEWRLQPCKRQCNTKRTTPDKGNFFRRGVVRFESRTSFSHPSLARGCLIYRA